MWCIARSIRTYRGIWNFGARPSGPRGDIFTGDVSAGIRTSVQAALNHEGLNATDLLTVYRRMKIPDAAKIDVNDDFAWLMDVPLPPPSPRHCRPFPISSVFDWWEPVCC